MKSVIEFNAPQPETSKYPYIGYMKNNVGKYFVLFTSPEKGFILKENEYLKVGRYSENWGEKEFVHFNGTITLEN